MAGPKESSRLTDDNIDCFLCALNRLYKHTYTYNKYMSGKEDVAGIQ